MDILLEWDRKGEFWDARSEDVFGTRYVIEHCTIDQWTIEISGKDFSIDQRLSSRTKCIEFAHSFYYLLATAYDKGASQGYLDAKSEVKTNYILNSDNIAKII